MPSLPPTRFLDRRPIAAFCLALCAFLVYNANFRLIGSGDTLPTRYLPLAIWRTGSLHLEAFDEPMNRGYETAYWVWRSEGHDHSRYPIVTPIVVAPLYAPAVWYLSVREWDSAAVRRVSAVMEKLCASLIAAASVAVMDLVLLGMVRPRIALLLAIAYAFGTNTWMTGSQALWQHGLSELLLVTILYAAPRAEERARWSVVAGICCALLLFNRPGDGLLVIAVSMFFLRPRMWKGFLVSAAVVSAPFLYYNVEVFGSIVGGYSQIYPGLIARDTIAEGIAGLLVSPAKGLFVFSPFLLLILAATPRRFHEAGKKRLALLLLLGFVAQLIVYARVPWEGGYCFGPRFLTGLLPVLIWLIAPIADALSRPLQAAFIVAIGLSIGMQTIGAFYYASSGMDRAYEKEPWTLWHPAYNTVLRDFRAGRVPFFQ